MDQEKINAIWSQQWQTTQGTFEQLCNSQLFKLGYSTVQQYVPEHVQTLLEIGAGTGRYGLRFALEYPSVHCTITDITEASITKIKQHAQQQDIHNVTVEQADASNLKYSDNTFDIVFADVVIQHIPDDQHVVKQLARVVRPGGLVIMTVVNMWNPHTLYKWLKQDRYEYGHEKSYTKHALTKLVQTAGLEVRAHDGFYAAYGLHRHRKKNAVYKWSAKIINRLSKIVDPYTNRWFSKTFGFERLIVARKPKI